MQPPPKVPPVDLSKAKPKAMPDWRPDHLKMLLTPRTGQPPNSLPPGAQLNFNDVPAAEQPGTDFDQPFGIRNFDRMNSPEKRWLTCHSLFFDRIADSKHPVVRENVFFNRRDTCSHRLGQLKNTSVAAKIEEFTKFQPHPILILMGYKTVEHFNDEVPPIEYRARVKSDADFAKMLAKDIMHIRNIGLPPRHILSHPCTNMVQESLRDVLTEVSLVTVSGQRPTISSNEQEVIHMTCSRLGEMRNPSLIVLIQNGTHFRSTSLEFQTHQHSSPQGVARAEGRRDLFRSHGTGSRLSPLPWI